MVKRLYNWSMGLLKFLLSVVGTLKDPKAAASMSTVLVLIVGAAYVLTEQVNAKHAEAMERIAKTEEKTNAMVTTQAEILVTLKYIGQSIDDVKISQRDTKTQVKETNDRVLGIARDVYLIKTNGNH